METMTVDLLSNHSSHEQNLPEKNPVFKLSTVSQWSSDSCRTSVSLLNQVSAASAVQHNAATLFYCEAPELFCGPRDCNVTWPSRNVKVRSQLCVTMVNEWKRTKKIKYYYSTKNVSMPNHLLLILLSSTLMCKYRFSLKSPRRSSEASKCNFANNNNNNQQNSAERHRKQTEHESW